MAKPGLRNPGSPSQAIPTLEKLTERRNKYDAEVVGKGKVIDLAVMMYGYIVASICLSPQSVQHLIRFGYRQMTLFSLKFS